MTRAKEIMKEADKVASANTQIIGDWGEHYLGFIHGAEWADAHPHWISVEDELPPITQWVLTYNPTYDEYHFDVERYGRGENLVDFGVTHWMPLPQPPKKGGKE